MPYNYAIVNNIFVLRQRRATPLATLIGAEGDCALEKIDPFCVPLSPKTKYNKSLTQK